MRCWWMGGLMMVLGVMSGDAVAWGPEGHAMVADMAEAHLTPLAAKEVRYLLEVEGYRHLDQVSSWADAIRSDAPGTGPWHYVDIPLYASGYAQSRDCHWDEHNQQVVDLTCVVAQLPMFVHVLADKTQGDDKRLVALKWVVHLVGDIHQPLHAEDDHDRGGNTIHMVFDGKQTNLHALWDVGVIERQFHWQLGPGYGFDHQAVLQESLRLDAEISTEQREVWAPSAGVSAIDVESVQWVNESHALAWQAYRHLPASMDGDWENNYQAWAWPVINQQLDKAGVRLAAVLNASLR